jgi:hypothetical protein
LARATFPERDLSDEAEGLKLSNLIFLHIVCASAWLGCVLVEAIFERSIDGSAPSRTLISRAHWRIDLAVEIPAFAGVVATGALLLVGTPVTSLVAVKIALGVLAVAVNIYCVWLVRRRLAAARACDWTRWEAIDHRQHQFGAIVLVAMLGALAIGDYLFSGG